LAVSRRESIRIISAAQATFVVAVRGVTVIPDSITSSQASYALVRAAAARAHADAG
jgi:flagellar biogenesis protein FliO